VQLVAQPLPDPAPAVPRADPNEEEKFSRICSETVKARIPQHSEKINARNSMVMGAINNGEIGERIVFIDLPNKLTMERGI
jgi:hypothetical protein